MLQQTQVATVRGYYERFLLRFPDVAALAAAPLEDVLRRWAGLGYYARARHLHRCAQAVAGEHGGRFPERAADLVRLPGIGPSTAAAIAAFCHGERAAILDGNVQRVLARYFAIEGDPRRGPVHAALLARAQELLPAAPAMPAYTQAIMDLGATVCTRARPDCAACPLARDCLARAQGRTGELPQRAPARLRPLRRALLMLHLHRGAVLLEERAPRGLWGGLLAPPFFARRADLLRALPAGLQARALPVRRHEFTHFTLAMRPMLVEDRAARRPPAGPGQRWLPLARADDAALPAPVLMLLREVRR